MLCFSFSAAFFSPLLSVSITHNNDVLHCYATPVLCCRCTSVLLCCYWCEEGWGAVGRGGILLYTTYSSVNARRVCANHTRRKA